MTHRVLVAEPHPLFREFLRTWLAGRGHAVVGVASAREARAALARDAFSLVAAEHDLPDGPGVDLLDALGPGRPPLFLIHGRDEAPLALMAAMAVATSRHAGATVRCFAKSKFDLRRLRGAIDEALAAATS